MELRQRIIEYAVKEGIDVIGFTDVKPFFETEKAINLRKKKDRLVFENREFIKGCNPKDLLEGARSIISLAVSYPIARINKETRHSAGYYGRISAYSLGLDYHKVLYDRMNHIIQYIQDMRGSRPFNYKTFVDSGALVDKAAAWRSGIGWFGKNTLIYTEGYGSGVFLGEILCDLDIMPDKPLTSKCGNCDLCIKACPTGALESPFTLDPYKCISYITQMSGFIPREKRDVIGNWIYGCDICQEVCPFNKRENSGILPVIEGCIDLVKLLKMQNKEFNNYFGKTALCWRGKNVIQRNAVIAMGNIGDEGAVRYLVELLQHPSPLVRGHVPWALRKIGSKKGKIALEKVLKTEREERVKNEIVFCLENYNHL